MEKTTLLLILALLTGAEGGAEHATKNLCDGIDDGDKGTNGVYYWRCKDGKVKAVGCEGSGNNMIIQPQDTYNVNMGMSMKCVSKVSKAGCHLPGNLKVYAINEEVKYVGSEWLCEESGFVDKTERPYSTAPNMCQWDMYKLKPGSCAYIESGDGDEIFLIECIADEQSPTVPKKTRMRNAINGESVAHCEKWLPQ